MSTSSPRVFLVGAGPGHPKLLTLRAVECLRQADLVIYDRLVPVRLLDYAPESAERIRLDDLPSRHVDHSPQVHEAMIAAARQGKCVVRLKGGDPFVFSRGGEEADALRQAGIDFEVVPGVTAGMAAPAYAGIPLTHRTLASAVAFVTGHEEPGKRGSSLDWQALARFPGTLVVYMGLGRLPQIVDALLANGKDPGTPAAAIHRGATPEHKTVTATLQGLPQAAGAAGLKPPVILVIGGVAGLHDTLAWFERLPLFGKCVLITRPRRQAQELADRLELLGAKTLFLPAVIIGPPLSWEPADRAIVHLADYQWLVFTSKNGVHGFLTRMLEKDKDLRALGSLKIAGIGAATAEALREFHLQPDLVPAIYSSECLAEELVKHAAGQRVLLARADKGRAILREELSRVAQVDEIVVYSQSANSVVDPEVLDALKKGIIDFVTVTSSNIAGALARLLPPECAPYIASGKLRFISISPITSAAMREAGLPVAEEAMTYTMDGVVEAILRLKA